MLNTLSWQTSGKPCRVLLSLLLVFELTITPVVKSTFLDTGQHMSSMPACFHQQFGKISWAAWWLMIWVPLVVCTADMCLPSSYILWIGWLLYHFTVRAFLIWGVGCHVCLVLRNIPVNNACYHGCIIQFAEARLSGSFYQNEYHMQYARRCAATQS